ncbi:MAG: T9SS C-terminal target domain-containing protein, partial [Flavobacteriales bacterium]
MIFFPLLSYSQSWFSNLYSEYDSIQPIMPEAHNESGIGNGEAYDLNVESSLQDNYIYRWPVPLIEGHFEVNVQVHFIYPDIRTIPNSELDFAMQEVYEMYAEQGIHINYLNRIDVPVSSGSGSLVFLHDNYYDPPSGPSPLVSNALNVAIFHHELVNMTNQGPFAMPNNVHIFSDLLPDVRSAIAMADHPNSDYILRAALGGIIGVQMGLFPIEFELKPTRFSMDFIEENHNCNRSGDFICETPPPSTSSLDCDNLPSHLSLFDAHSNIMRFTTLDMSLARNITEEQARKIRYNFASDTRLYECLTSNSTILFSNYLVVPLVNNINTNTTWDKPAATLRINVAENATFTSTDRIDFAPGKFTINNYFQIERSTKILTPCAAQVRFDEEIIHPGIRVEPGSKLIVSNGTLSSYYSYFPWQGIIGVGSSNTAQTPQFQSVIQLTNAKLINAQNAFINFDRVDPIDYTGPAIISTTGSIIQATNTEFINCRRTAQFLEYANNQGTHIANNVSYFRECKILHNDQYPFLSKPLGITMHRVDGIQIRGCEFINTMTDPNSISLYRGDAIVSINATYTIDQHCSDPECSNPVPSVISGYHRGITSSRKTHPFFNISVRNTTFYNNFYGAYFNDQPNNLRFTENTLVIPEGIDISNPHMSNHPYGLYLHNSRSFTIEENHFTKAPAMIIPNLPTLPFNFQREPVGLIVNNTLTASDQIYNNTFGEMDLGILALEFNRVDNCCFAREGLQLRCNDFNDGEFDIYAPLPINGKQNTLAGFQGEIQRDGLNQIINHLLAGNRFSHTNSTSGYYDFEYHADGSYNIVYFSHDAGSEPRVEPRFNHVHDVVNSPTNEVYNELISCPSKLNQGGITISELGNLRLQVQDIETDRIFLSDLIDGGSTPNLLAQIFATPESEFYDLYVNLIAESPYLSEEALLEIIQLEGFPDILLRNILIENPQSYLNQAIWDEVLNRTPPLPQFMIDDILNGTNTIGAKQLLQARIVGKQLQAEQLANALIGHLGEEYASGEFLAAVDSALVIYDLMDMPHYYLQKALLLHAEGLGGEADALDAMVEHSAVGEGLLKAEFEAIKEVYEIIFTIEDSLNSGQIAALKAIESGNENAAAATAHFILALEGLEDSLLVDPTYFPSVSPPNKRMTKNPSVIEKVSLNHLHLYPNPASNFTTLQYQTMGVGGKTTIQILDVSGKVVYTSFFEAKVEGAELISLPTLASGMY